MRKLSVEEVVEALFGHRPLYEQNPEGNRALIRGWVKCSCGAAVADGTTRYEKLWSDHMKEVLTKLTSTEPAPDFRGEFTMKVRELIYHWKWLSGIWNNSEGAALLKASAAALESVLDAAVTWAAPSVSTSPSFCHDDYVASVFTAPTVKTSSMEKFLSAETVQYIIETLNRDLSRARSAVQHEEKNLERMPFDHDARNSLSKYQQWESESRKALDEVQGISKPHINDMLNFTAEEKARLEAFREGARSSRMSTRINVFARLSNWRRYARHNPNVHPEAQKLLIEFADEIEKLIPPPGKS